MKLLLLGSFRTGALENYFVAGFKKYGYEVETFTIEQQYFGIVNRVAARVANAISPKLLLSNLNNAVIKKAKDTRPDIILICKGMALFPATVQELKGHTKLLANYNPDHPYNFYSRGAGNQFVKDSLSAYHIFFSYSANIAKAVKEKYGIDSYIIPFGYDPAATQKYPVPAKVDSVSKFLFFGAWDEQRASFMNKIERSDVEIYGDPEWGTRTRSKQFVQQNFQQQKLYGAELYQKVLAYSGVINLLRPQNMVEGSHNMRTFEVPGYGGLLMTEYTEEQASFFEPDKEAIYFNSPQELNDKMDVLRQDPQMVANIKKAALQRSITSGYSYHDRCKTMIDIFTNYL